VIACRDLKRRNWIERKPVRPGRMIAGKRRGMCRGSDSEELLETKVLGKPM